MAPKIDKTKKISPVIANEHVSSDTTVKSKTGQAIRKHHAKVIRDSFSFPEEDYLKILQIKSVCLQEGIAVKKGEVLRAGLHLLMQLSSDELKQIIGQVERVKTGRPVVNKEL